MADAVLRTFVAIPMPPEAIEHLRNIQQQLRELTGNDVRWVGPEGMHLTLKFLGATPSTQVPAIERAIAAAAAEASGFSYQLSAVGSFGERGWLRVLWVGLAQQPAQLDQLYQNAEARLVALGFPAERRPYAPHITLGRVRESTPEPRHRSLAELLRRPEFAAPGPVAAARELVLYQSTLTPSGAVYSHLAHAPLGGEGARG